MNRLAALSGDYYADQWYSDEEKNGSSSEEEEAEYDDVQKVMAKVAGVEPRSCRNNRSKKMWASGPSSNKSPGTSASKLTEFDFEMEGDLDAAFNSHKIDKLGDTSCFTLVTNKHTQKVRKIEELKEVKDSMEVEDMDPALGLTDDPAELDQEYADNEGDPLYDPEEDSANQAWVDAHRRKDQKRGEAEKLEGSDAILNCPACMALLCRDCQRHSTFKTQYRAMFVQNCHVNKEEKLYMPSGPSKENRKRKTDSGGALKKNETIPCDKIPADCNPDDLFSPVLCSVCRTHVGVFDTDEIYHFFNVLSSYT